MKHPVRIILKSVSTDANGQLIQSNYKTIDIDNEEIENLLFKGAYPHGRTYEVVGAESLNKEKLTKDFIATISSLGNEDEPF